eukprot:TRINITY_DN3804_c0_g2_i1.p1 TRINITY_DN3804_c0_g2~~TRINITY_DN3804_c0_g2_i1.p1  ORF type:complete len:572 (-),score=60.39 TRINITY_DN3804_c0_g2_i1:43-1758(-)
MSDKARRAGRCPNRSYWGGSHGGNTHAQLSLFLLLLCLLSSFFPTNSSLTTTAEEEETLTEFGDGGAAKMNTVVYTLAALSEDVHSNLQRSVLQLRRFFTHHPFSPSSLASFFLPIDSSKLANKDETKGIQQEQDNLDDTIEIGRPLVRNKFQFRAASEDKGQQTRSTTIISSLPQYSHAHQKRDDNNNTNIDSMVYHINSCSNVGKSIKAEDATNYCVGGCKIKQTVCSQALGYSNPFYVNQTIKYCRIIKIECGGKEDMVFETEAYPVKMNCDGHLRDPSPTNLYTCLVNQVLYSGVLLNFTMTPDVNCHVDTLKCNGKKVSSFPYSPSSSDSCVVTSDKCGATQRCYSVTRVCLSDDPNNCVYLRLPCDDPCWEQQCICPIDMKGDDCSDNRPFKCALTMLNPTPNCIQPPGLSKLTDSDAICFQYSTEDIVPFLFNISCSFTSSSSISDVSANYPFQYQIRNGNTFAISSSDVAQGLSFTFHPFNLKYYLSESVATLTKPLSPAHLIGNGTIQIPFSPAINLLNLPNAREYMMGGRTYIECYVNIPSAGLETPVVNRLFLDLSLIHI